MSVILNTQAVNAAINKDIKDLLLSGAKVNYSFNGSEFVYEIEGVHALEISVNGYIIDKGEVKHPKPSNDTVYISACKGFNALNIAYKSLITYLNGYIPKGGLMLKLKDESKGYSPDNIKLVNKFTGEDESWDVLQKISEHKHTSSSQAELKTIEKILDEDKTVLDPKDLYTEVVSTIEYVTEDGVAFSNLEIAAAHQQKVDVAKDVANLVLEHQKELYGVAESAYLRLMDYKGKKPYFHFKDVMDNYNGIVERKTKEVVKFKEFIVGDSPVFAHLFSEKSYTQDKADEILSMLALAEDVYLNLKGLSQMTN